MIVIILMGYVLNYMQKLTLDYKQGLDDKYALLKFPLAEHSFAWIWLWNDYYKDIEWMEINNNTCLFLTFEDCRYIWGPPLPGNKLADTLNKCFTLCEEYNANNNLSKQPAIMYIPEELSGNFSELAGLSLEEQDSDYIYSANDIKEFKGKKLKDKRNKRNFFVKNYDYSVMAYEKALHEDACLELLRKWQKQKQVSKKDGEKLLAEVNANKRVLSEGQNLGIKGMVVQVSGKIEGYIFGENTNQKMCTLFFGKTNLEIKGLSQFIYSEFLKINFAECELVNDGESWGVDYLEHSKGSYKPLMTKKSYMLVQNE